MNVLSYKKEVIYEESRQKEDTFWQKVGDFLREMWQKEGPLTKNSRKNQLHSNSK